MFSTNIRNVSTPCTLNVTGERPIFPLFVPLVDPRIWANGSVDPQEIFTRLVVFTLDFLAPVIV